VLGDEVENSAGTRKMTSTTLDHFVPLIPLPVPLFSGTLSFTKGGRHHNPGMDMMTTTTTTRMVSYDSSRVTTSASRYHLSVSSLPFFGDSSDEYDGDDDDDYDDGDDQLTKESATSVDSSDQVVRMAADSFLDNNNKNKPGKDTFTMKHLSSFVKEMQERNKASQDNEEDEEDEWSFATDPQATFESFDDASELTCDSSCYSSSVGSDSSGSTKLTLSKDNKNNNSNRYFSASVSYNNAEEEDDDDRVDRRTSSSTTTVTISDGRVPPVQPFLDDRRIMDFLNELCDKSSPVSTHTTPTPSTMTKSSCGLSVSTSCKDGVGQETLALRV
jgi:hypothetical protein